MLEPKRATDSPVRRAFYDEIEPKNLAPLWTVLSTLIPRTPNSNCQPYCWHFDEVRPFLIEASKIISAEEAERRVLILENPGIRGRGSVTDSLYAGLQLVLPGETAPAHRHSQSALRFVLEGEGTYTSVNGERTRMHYGDFIITPARAWHDHRNHSDQPMIWMDVLDIPMVMTFAAGFFEKYTESTYPIIRHDGDSVARYGNNMMPCDYRQKPAASPIINYSYARARDSLEQMRKEKDWDPCHGLKLRYINPADGDFAMPTIASFIQLLPKGFSTSAYRSTDASIYVAVEGSGRSIIDGQEFTWGPKDIFVVPSWMPISHFADSDAILFSCSDRSAQQKLGFWREDRGSR